MTQTWILFDAVTTRPVKGTTLVPTTTDLALQLVSGSGSGITSSNTRGQEYDATGGQVDDRTFGQKAKDAFKPGSQVGTHG